MCCESVSELGKLFNPILAAVAIAAAGAVWSRELFTISVEKQNVTMEKWCNNVQETQ